MDISLWLTGLGVPSFRTTIYVQVPTTATTEIIIGKILPTQIGWIYGLSVYTDGKDAKNRDLPTTANAANLWLNFKQDATDFFQGIRFSEMNYAATGQQPNDNQRYLPVGIPGTIDLSQSTILNPTGITGANLYLSINMWYIGINGYNTMIKANLIKPLGKIKQDMQG